MPIPTLDVNGELPEGVHTATLDDVEREFGSSSDRRKQLMKGLRNAVTSFDAAGVKTIFLDGSFTTSKEDPNDIDGCWSVFGDIDETKLDPLFWNFKDESEAIDFREQVKTKYGLDFFIAEWTEGGSGKPFPEFFQTNKDGDAKGIIKVEL